MFTRRKFLKAGMVIAGSMLTGGGKITMAAESKMYEEWRLNNLPVKNRLASSAIFEFGADDGKITDRITEHYRKLAEGGAGLIITGMEAIYPAAGIGPSMVNTAYLGYESDMKKIVDIIHKNNARVLIQLQHAGYRTAWKTGGDKIGVCEKEVAPDCVYHAATEEELKKIAEGFGDSALRCKKAGSDGIQIHAAHGFLINTFLSPYFNHRTDSYGGSIENRARLLLEIYDNIRNKVGDDFIVSVKIPFSDLTEPSISSKDCIWVCKELEERGLNMIEITSGISYDGGPTSFTPFIRPGEEGNFLAGAQIIAENVQIPVLSVCGYRSPEFIEAALMKNKITAISLGRPLIREPDLPERWKFDRTKAACISCNQCYGSKGIILCIFNHGK